MVFHQLEKVEKFMKISLDKETRKPYIIRAFNQAFPSDSRKAESRIGTVREEGFSLSGREELIFELKSGAIVIEPICHFQTR